MDQSSDTQEPVEFNVRFSTIAERFCQLTNRGDVPGGSAMPSESMPIKAAIGTRKFMLSMMSVISRDFCRGRWKEAFSG